jgi:hypothetical protein
VDVVPNKRHVKTSPHPAPILTASPHDNLGVRTDNGTKGRRTETGHGSRGTYSRTARCSRKKPKPRRASVGWESEDIDVWKTRDEAPPPTGPTIAEPGGQDTIRAHADTDGLRDSSSSKEHCATSHSLGNPNGRDIVREDIEFERRATRQSSHDRHRLLDAGGADVRGG